MWAINGGLVLMVCLCDVDGWAFGVAYTKPTPPHIRSAAGAAAAAGVCVYIFLFICQQQQQPCGFAAVHLIYALVRSGVALGRGLAGECDDDVLSTVRWTKPPAPPGFGRPFYGKV